jgi:hypothetical protein
LRALRKASIPGSSPRQRSLSQGKKACDELRLLHYRWREAQVIATVIRVVVLLNQPKLPIHIAFLLILI